MKAPFLKSPLVPRGSGHHFSSGCHLSFWERFLGLLTSLLCTKFPTELLCSDSCLLPSKLIQNSLAYLKRRRSFCTFSNKLLGITFCSSYLTQLKVSSGGLWYFAVHISKPKVMNHSVLATRNHTWRACAAAQLPSDWFLQPLRLRVQWDYVLFCYWTGLASQRGAVNNTELWGYDKEKQQY